MTNNRYLEIPVNIFLPLFRAIYVVYGTMFFLAIFIPFLSAMFLSPDSGLFDDVLSLMTYDVWFLILGVLFIWLSFYFGIAVIFKREELLDRFYEFSMSLKMTALFGAIVLALSLCDFFLHLQVKAKVAYGLLTGVSLFVFIPVVLLETTRLGALMETRKGYSRFKSQCYSYLMFLFLPLLLTRLISWLFRMVFVI